ncbi:hypothetical protein DFP72DRAFT_500381 [Ephemerocybe angulata]|uniref:Uncharacterized protein n=1 Tax=Ephemerocybe angulata TaxID=980116 RepID=A0A8H6HR31_9AGAR|nr:hypothetical protein DFP72DRAFT_500381 [Tulosesus angulatus]
MPKDRKRPAVEDDSYGRDAPRKKAKSSAKEVKGKGKRDTMARFSPPPSPPQPAVAKGRRPMGHVVASTSSAPSGSTHMREQAVERVRVQRDTRSQRRLQGVNVKLGDVPRLTRERGALHAIEDIGVDTGHGDLDDERDGDEGDVEEAGEDEEPDTEEAEGGGTEEDEEGAEDSDQYPTNSDLGLSPRTLDRAENEEIEAGFRYLDEHFGEDFTESDWERHEQDMAELDMRLAAADREPDDEDYAFYLGRDWSYKPRS